MGTSCYCFTRGWMPSSELEETGSCSKQSRHELEHWMSTPSRVMAYMELGGRFQDIIDGIVSPDQGHREACDTRGKQVETDVEGTTPRTQFSWCVAAQEYHVPSSQDRPQNTPIKPPYYPQPPNPPTPSHTPSAPSPPPAQTPPSTPKHNSTSNPPRPAAHPYSDYTPRTNTHQPAYSA